MNIPCAYSESRKHGKKSLRKKLAQDRARRVATANGNTNTSPHIVAAAPDGHPHGDQPHQLWPRATMATDRPAAAPDIDSSVNPAVLVSPLSQSLLPGQEPFPGSLSNTDASALLSLYGGFGDTAGIDVDLDAFANWDLAGLSPSGLPSPLPPAPRVRDQQQSLFISGAEKGTCSATAGENEVTSSSALVTATHTTSSSSSTMDMTHDCEAQAISILRSLQHGEVVPGTTSCSTTDSVVHYAGFNLRPPFDRVLSTNRAALDGWKKLMRCSCVQCPHLILLYVSVLNKMLFWYRIAASNEWADGAGRGETEGDNSSGSSGSGSSSEATTPTSMSPPTRDKFGVQTAVIKVGLLGLDAEDQANLRRFLLMRELRRMEAAIDELVKLDRTSMEEDLDAEAWQVVKWSLAGVLRVRDEVQDVIRELSKCVLL